MAEAWIIDVARTPRGVGKPEKGALSGVHPQRILSTVLKALAELPVLPELKALPAPMVPKFYQEPVFPVLLLA